MSEKLRDALNNLEMHLRRLNRPVVKMMNPGLSPHDVDDPLVARHLRATPDLVALYGWRDGTDASTGLPLDDLHLVPGFYMLSIHDALANYDRFIKSPRWRPSWLPILANGGGDFLVVELSTKSCQPVIHFRIEQDQHPIEYESVTSMFETFSAAFDRKIFYVEGNGYLEMDDSAYATVAKQLNPAVRWWAE